MMNRFAVLAGLDEARCQSRRSLAEQVRAHRAAVLSAQNIERLKRLLAEAERSAKGGRA